MQLKVILVREQKLLAENTEKRKGKVPLHRHPGA